MAERKELIAIRQDSGPLYRIKYRNGGELPKDLTGLYTSEKKGIHAITAYLQSKGRVNGTSKSK